MTPHWSDEQQQMLRTALDAGAVVAFVCSDAWGGGANGGGTAMRCADGARHHVDGPLVICTKHALHGTMAPHRWRGARVWIAVFGSVVQRQEDKIASLQRTIVGEIRPEEAIEPGVALRLGARALEKARGADLGGADLGGAYCPCPPPAISESGWEPDARDVLRRRSSTSVVKKKAQPKATKRPTRKADMMERAAAR